MSAIKSQETQSLNEQNKAIPSKETPVKPLKKAVEKSLGKEQSAIEHKRASNKKPTIKETVVKKASTKEKSIEEKNIEEKNNNEKINNEKINKVSSVTNNEANSPKEPQEQLDRPGTIDCDGVLEVMSDGYGFLRCENYLSGSDDIYVGNSYIRKFNLKTGDFINGKCKSNKGNEKFTPLLYINKLNGDPISSAFSRVPFEKLTPIYPKERLKLENTNEKDYASRIVDLLAPIGKGQRGLIVAPPKAGKTTFLKTIANSIVENNPDVHLIVLLIDERPEEVTDMKRSVNGEVISSTFDELPEHHIRVAEMVLERAHRLCEHKKDVVIVMDSITRLARAYNLTLPPSGRTLSGGLDPGCLNSPKRFFGSARNIEETGSITIIASALVETGSRMDDVIYEEIKGTGNMEVHLSREIAQKRIFPAIDIKKSSTRKEELLLNTKELQTAYEVRRKLENKYPDEALHLLISMLSKTKNNKDFIEKFPQWQKISSNF